MTSPQFDPSQDSDALTSITRMLTGTQVLKDEPGVVWALAQQKAQPQDAQTIDQFMQGLNAEKQVRLAQAGGHKITLDPSQKTLLGAMGVDYSQVEYTHQDAVNAMAQQLEQQKGVTVKRDAQGNAMLGADGQFATAAAKHGRSFFGHVIHDLNNWVVKPVGQIASPLMKPWNVVDSTVGDLMDASNDGGLISDLVNPFKAGHDITSLVTGHPGDIKAAPNFSALPNDLERIVGASPEQAQQMREAGYNPNNPFSIVAYRASGKEHADLTPLEQRWDNQHPQGLYGWNGKQAVAEATAFIEDPKGYTKKIENDPASYAADGSMTPAAAAKLQAVSSKQFMDLARQVDANRASIGNSVMRAMGVDPIKHPTLFTVGSAGTDMAASFMIDPVLLAGKTFKVAKMSQVGIDTLSDAQAAAKVLDTENSTGVFARGVQRRTQNFIDMAHEMNAAQEAGDLQKAAALSARINAQYKEWAPMVPDVLGKNQLLAPSSWVEKDGKVVESSMYGPGEPIHTLNDMANYIASRNALTRLMNGRAAVQASLMPGSVSNLGLRALKGGMAERMTARSFARVEKTQQQVITAAHADPALAQKLVSDGMLLRIQPEADDAVNAITGDVVAHGNDESGTLASAERGARYELTPAGKGEVAFNLRAYGTPIGAASNGWASPTAIAARARLAAQRISTLLPRNTVIDIDDAQSADKIYKIAMTYLNRGDANALRAAWETGDGGTRKAIVHGVLDQVGHAAGYGKTESGQRILDALKTRVESYSSVADDVNLDGDALALHAGQVRTRWLLPDFRTLQQAAAKVGLWETTMGRALTSHQADLLMSQMKLGMLFKPSTITRNQLEGWLRTALEGQAGNALQARAFATAPNKELWARGIDSDVVDAYREARGKVEGLQSMLKSKGLAASQRANAREQMDAARSLMADYEKRPIVQHLLASEAGDEKLAKQIAEGTLMSGEVLGRSRVGQKIAEFAPFALAGRAWRRLFGTTMDDADLQALATLGPDELAEAMEGYGAQILEGDLGMIRGARQASEITRAGYGPATLRYVAKKSAEKTARRGEAKDQIVSWTQHDTEGTEGADRFANALAMRVNATPSVAKAVLDRLEDPSVTLDHVVQALDDPAIAGKMRQTAYGKVYWTDPSGPAQRAVTPEQVLLGKQEWAQKVVNDYAYLMMGQNGQYNQALADFIREEGRAPDAAWIHGHIEDGEDGFRPAGVLSPDVIAVPNGGKAGLFSTLQDVQGAGYQWMVERPLQRTTSAPVFLANYAKARRGLNDHVEQLVEQGISRQAAENLAKELSIRNAWVKTEQLIDDPGQKSQFDVVARNIFPFSRATQAMIRRWGGGLWQDPVRAQKMMLAYEGAVHSGFVYNNAYGEPTFVYPGSGAMNMMLRTLAQVPGFGGLAKFPLSASMTGGVLMSVPGADNPFRMSMGPMVTIPLREISKLLPGDQRILFDEVDSAINGPIGQGQTVGQLVPTAVRKFWTALNPDDRNSALASATMGAIANLAAGGHLPPPDASPAERQAYLSNIRTQVRSQLFLRAVFGLFAPAPPTSPSEGTSASQSDYAFHVRGAGQLSDEYKMILSDVGGDIARASAIWTALHPDKTVYTIAHSQATTSHVALPATTAALDWMTKNEGFVHRYGNVAAYFLPESTGQQAFNDQAYKTQIELGLRQRKTPAEFLNDIYVRHAEAVYYPSIAEFDAKIQAAKDAGNTDQAAQWRAIKSEWSNEFKLANPAFQVKIDSYPDARAMALGQLQNIRQMLKDGDVPDGHAALLGQLVRAYDNYTAFAQQHKGSDTASVEARSAAKAMFDQWALEHLAGTPLADLYSGVFRVLNTNLVNLNNPSGG